MTAIEKQVQAIVAAFNAGRQADALRLCRKAVRSSPQDPVFNHLLAAASFAVHDNALALSSAELSLSVGSENPAVRLLAGRAARALGRLKAAEDHFRQLPPSMPGALVELARTLEQADKREQARLVWGHARQIDPASHEAAARLGRLLWEAGDFEGARDHLEFAVTGRAPASAWFDLGLVRQDCGCLADAADAFRSALLLKPDDGQAAFNLAAALQQLGDMDGAVSAYRQAYAISQPSLGMIANALTSAKNGLLFIDKAELKAFLGR